MTKFILECNHDSRRLSANKHNIRLPDSVPLARIVVVDAAVCQSSEMSKKLFVECSVCSLCRVPMGPPGGGMHQGMGMPVHHSPHAIRAMHHPPQHHAHHPVFISFWNNS